MIFKDINVAKETLKNNGIIEFLEKTLILASNSASRFKIMEKANLNFVAMPSLVNEEEIKSKMKKVETEEEAVQYVKTLAYAKADWLKKHTKNAVVLAADTIAFYKNEILEKPKDEADARRIFSALSNSVHVAITGVCIMDKEKVISFEKISPVKMLEIPQELQDVLVKDKLTYTYAGGYCVDGNLGDRTIVSKEDFNNVMGLPIEDIVEKLKEEGYDFSK